MLSSFFGGNSSSSSGGNSSQSSSSQQPLQIDPLDASTKVELTISCNSLPNLDYLSKSDPQVILYIKDNIKQINNLSSSMYMNANWIEYGRTEVVWDNLNPKFVKSFILDYRFETNQFLKFVVVDIDNEKSKNVNDQDLIGEMQCTLAEIVGSKGGRIMKPLIHPHHLNRGYISVRSEEVQGVNDVVSLKLSATSLDKKDWFGKSDPFVVISRAPLEDTDFQPVYKSEYYKNTLNASWKPFQIQVQKLNNGDYERPLRIEVFDWNRSGAHELIGYVAISLRQLLDGGNNKKYDLINPELQKKNKKYKNSGILSVDYVGVQKVNSFLDYVRGGYDISLVVAIDFTASNGDPTQPSSLHFRSQNQLNDYQKAILGVGEILNYYDKDKQYPVYGFGAKIPTNNYQVSHCFPANFNWNNPEVQGVNGILDAYNFALSKCVLYGPTNFAGIINTAASFAQRDAETTYYILLILTDGEICDMENTISEIVRASTLPLSIIIVGIGNADFGKMDVLDADDNPLVSRGVKMSRDIVQFVPFNNYKNAHPSLLAKEVLAEVPTQFLSYMQQHNIKPKPPIEVQSFYGGLQQSQMDQPTNAFTFNGGNNARSASISNINVSLVNQQQAPTTMNATTSVPLQDPTTPSPQYNPNATSVMYNQVPPQQYNNQYNPQMQVPPQQYNNQPMYNPQMMSSTNNQGQYNYNNGFPNYKI
ncbi:hypothetical protein ABK040_011387 [Willaertia magna]